MLETMRLAALSAILITVQPVAGFAQSSKAEELYEALSLSEVLTVMQEEGVGYGGELAADFFPGRELNDWEDDVAKIYDLEAMETEVKSAFFTALEGDDLDGMLDFFNTDVGQEIIDLEISARRALMDEEVEALAEENAAMAMEEETDRFLLVQDFVDTNDLIEANVVGALNSNYAFYTGLIDGGALGGDLSEDQILADVWGREPEIRQSTTEWAFSFLLLAYQPLNDDELKSYTEFSRTESGVQLNDALFEAFDLMLVRISRDLGLAISKRMLEQDI